MLGRTTLSRAILLRTLKNTADNVKQSKRNAGHGVWTYRMPPPAAKKRERYLAQALGGVVWWWILWHCATEPEHLIGDWPYVDPSTWSDEELGIPPDTKGSLKK